MSVVLFIHHAKRKCRTVLISMTCLALPYLSILSLKRHDRFCKKELLNIKCVNLIVTPCIFCRITSIYQPTNAHIISNETLLKHFKTLRHISILSDHHQGALFLAKVMLQYSQFNSYLQTRCCGSISCCVGKCCGAVARCASAHRATAPQHRWNSQGTEHALVKYTIHNKMLTVRCLRKVRNRTRRH